MRGASTDSGARPSLTLGRLLSLVLLTLALVLALGLPAAAHYVPVASGWNLVAGGPGSDAGGLVLFRYTGTSYQSIQAAQMETGKGYWVKAPSVSALRITTTATPVPVSLAVGWSLIGNSGDVPVVLPEGLVGYVFAEGRYISTSVLEPGQGAWVKTTAPQRVDLAEAPVSVVNVSGSLPAQHHLEPRARLRPARPGPGPLRRHPDRGARARW